MRKKINYVACFEEFGPIPSGIEVTIEDKEKHIVGERRDPYGNFRGYMIGIPENGLSITIHNNSDKQFYGGLTSEFNDGAFYMLESNDEVLIQLYGSYAQGPDGRASGFAGGLELETSVGLLQEYYPYLRCVPLDTHSLKYTANKKLNVYLDSYQMGEEFSDGVGIIISANEFTEIWSYAFNGYSGLTSMEIPSSVTSIGEYAFSGCTNLPSLTFNGTKNQWLNINLDTNWNTDSVIETIICIDGSLTIGSNYVACFQNPFTNTSNFEVTVEDMDMHTTGNYIKVPETGLNITIKNISEQTYNAGLTNEFNEGPFYELAPNTEVIIQLCINSYGSVYAKGPDGRTGGFVSSGMITLPDGTSLLEYGISFDASNV